MQKAPRRFVNEAEFWHDVSPNDGPPRAAGELHGACAVIMNAEKMRLETFES